MTGIAHKPVPIQARSVTDLIGNTPLLALPRVAAHVAPVQVLAKAEWYNPGGSVKDRAALHMIRDGERRGVLTKDKVLLDATSGNTGIAYAMIAAERGYRVTLCLPKNASVERKQTLLAYGAELVLTDPGEGTDGAQRKAKQMVADDPDRYFYPDQYNNDANWRAHYDGTGREIWDQTQGRVTHFVAGLGTTGTFMGTTRRLREFNPEIQCISMQPDGPLHGLEGMKHMPTAIVPGIYDPSSGRRRDGRRHRRRPRGRAAAGPDRGAAGRPLGRGEPGGGRAAGRAAQIRGPGRRRRCHDLLRLGRQVPERPVVGRSTHAPRGGELAVSDVLPLILTDAQKRQIEADGVSAYPNECCGILYGRDVEGQRVVGRLETVANAYAADEQFHRFSIGPADLMRAERSCRDGELVLGFYHSHPDHPARPSETDRLNGWPFYSYVIVAIHDRKPVDMTSWVLDEATERFGQQPIP